MFYKCKQVKVYKSIQPKFTILYKLALSEGVITITPLEYDLTNRTRLDDLRDVDFLSTR